MHARSSRALAVSIAMVAAFAQTPARAEPASPAASSTEEEARRLYEEGLKHYDLSEYEEAVTAFRKAYLIASAPELLFDIAQAYRKQGPGRCREALDFYRSYLRVDPNTPRREDVETSIARMEACADNAPPRVEKPVAPSVMTEAPPPAPSSPRSASSAIVPVTLGASGLALALAGGGLFVWSRLRYDALEDGCAPSCDPARADAPRVAQPVGLALLGVGAALVTTGVVAWLLRPHASDGTARATWRTYVQGEIPF